MSNVVLGGFFLVVALVSLAAVFLWIWSLVDALRRPDSAWTAADQNKIVWVVVITVLGVLGSILYLFLARPALQRAPA